MVLAQQDEREAFVVAQQHIIGRAEALDELGFEQQRLGFAFGGDDGHRARLRDHALEAARQAVDLDVVGHAIAQRPRLAPYSTSPRASCMR